jgi:hypothetical protein
MQRTHGVNQILLDLYFSKQENNSYLTSALDGASGQHHTPAARYTPVSTGGWASEQVWKEATGKEPLSLPGIEPLST